MKKIFSLLFVLILSVTVLCSCGEEKPTLKVYNAGEYIDTGLISEFEKENNCKVIYETFDSNESMYTKVSSGELYDVIIPSDYMIERLIKEDMLSEIDWSKITNKKKKTKLFRIEFLIYDNNIRIDILSNLLLL